MNLYLLGCNYTRINTNDTLTGIVMSKILINIPYRVYLMATDFILKNSRSVCLMTASDLKKQS
ncbi:MAG: hypothetical protein AMXMBFR68_12580 [Ignavibacteria bacterium]